MTAPPPDPGEEIVKVRAGIVKETALTLLLVQPGLHAWVRREEIKLIIRRTGQPTIIEMPAWLAIERRLEFER